MLIAFCSAKARCKRAFLVGISHYDVAINAHQWSDINGLNDVMLISRLLKKQGFHVTQIIDQNATYKNIISELKLFISNTRPGDLVYLHFSGHGQPVEDVNHDETDGWDESFIPIDACKIYKKGIYEGEYHILDDDINKFVTQLRRKVGNKGFVYVIIDACHAGTESRGNEKILRGTHAAFCYTKGLVYKPLVDKRMIMLLPHSAKLADVMFFEACRADQVNREIFINGKFYGALSYNISQAMLECQLGFSPKKFLACLMESIAQKGRWPNSQNMVIETSLTDK